MNEVVVDDTTESFTQRAVPLLKEYLRKLRQVKQQLRELRQEYEAASEAKSKDAINIIKVEFQALERYLNRVRPAVLRFGQQVSGMIDQGNVSPLTRVELQLRLAELESTLQEMIPLLNAYRPR